MSATLLVRIFGEIGPSMHLMEVLCGMNEAGEVLHDGIDEVYSCELSSPVMNMH